MCGVKTERTRALPREHAIEDECMDMNIQIEGPAKPLNHRNAAASAGLDALILRASSEQAVHRAKQHADDRPAQIVVPRQLVPQPVRQTQDPLPDGHVREHVIHEVSWTSRSRPQSRQRNRANPPASKPH
jgi:hypothetical protein